MRIFICLTIAVVMLVSPFVPLQAAAPHKHCWWHNHHHHCHAWGPRWRLSEVRAGQLSDSGAVVGGNVAKSLVTALLDKPTTLTEGPRAPTITLPVTGY